MKITPDTTITLYSGVGIGEEKQLIFSTRLKQTDYFASKKVAEVKKCTTVKNKVGWMKIPIKPISGAGQGDITGETIATCNYMSFVNPNFDNKTIYCYIVDYDYLNNETALIRYMVDHWQTWGHDVTIRDSFIDRETMSQGDWLKVEANPYRSDVPQMVTAEPLITPMGYEKPFYHIKLGCDPNDNTGWDHDSDDGFGVLATRYTAADLEKMLEGDWAYWNVMLVLAPTDWSAYTTSSDTVWNNQDVIVREENMVKKYYVCIASPGAGREWNPDEWMEIHPANADSVTGELSFTGTVSIPALSASNTNYAAGPENNPHMYANLTNAAKSFTPANPSASADIGDLRDWGVIKDWHATESGPQAMYNKILSDYNIKVYQAGQTRTDDGKYTWSAKPRGCDVLIITEQDGWETLSKFLCLYNAVSQIVGIFGVPVDVMNLGTIDDASPSGTTETYPFEYLSTSDTIKAKTSAARTSLSTEGVQKAVTNKKLLTSPFSYLRVIAPNGQIKEYNYELFSDVASGTLNNVRFKMLFDICGDNPKLYFIPDKYNVVNTLYSGLKNGVNDAMYPGHPAGIGPGTQLANCLEYNLSEAICIEGFPEISFNTDGYLTFLGNQYASIAANNDSLTKLSVGNDLFNTNMDRVNRQLYTGAATHIINSTASGAIKGSEGGIVGAVAGGAGGLLTSTSEAAINLQDAQMAAQRNRDLAENKGAMYNESELWAKGDLISSDNPYSKRFNDCKPAYANSAYTGGTGGVISYIRGIGLFDITILHVQLREEILDYYDKWFDLYGYASGRCGLPYVYNFMHQTQAMTNDDLPHWSTVNGKDSTYIKTHDIKVEHAMLPVADAIAAMFNSGIRFEKGDLS